MMLWVNYFINRYHAVLRGLGGKRGRKACWCKFSMSGSGTDKRAEDEWMRSS